MAVVRSFVHFSHDPTKGTDQKGNVFWDCIQSHFSTMVNQASRTAVALSQRWKGLQTAVSKLIRYHSRRNHRKGPAGMRTNMFLLPSKHTRNASLVLSHPFFEQNTDHGLLLFQVFEEKVACSYGNDVGIVCHCKHSLQRSSHHRYVDGPLETRDQCWVRVQDGNHHEFDPTIRSVLLACGEA